MLLERGVRVRSLILVLGVASAGLSASEGKAQTGCTVSVEGLHWCDSPITFSFDGGDWVNPFNGGLVMRAAVAFAIDQINFLVSQGIDLHLSEVGAGTGSIRLLFGPLGNHPVSGIALLGQWTPVVGSGGTYAGGVLVFNSSLLYLGTAYSLETVALHELMHALGLGGAHGSCPGDTLMLESLAPGVVRTTIDATAIAALECIYGNEIFDVCGQVDGLWIRTSPLTGGVTIVKGTCDGCGPTCSSLLASEEPSASASSAIVYELSVSEGGGPFVVVATLSESDFVGGSYDFVPTQDYTVALLRLERLDGGVSTGEAQTWDPINIAGVPPPSVPSFGPAAIWTLSLVLLASGSWRLRRSWLA